MTEIYECYICGKGAVSTHLGVCEDCVAKYGRTSVAVQQLVNDIINAGYQLYMCGVRTSLMKDGKVVCSVPFPMGDLVILWRVAMREEPTDE